MLHIDDITFRLGSRLLFDRASAGLPDDARIGFVGRNGAGKTTLFNIISGALSVESGQIRLPRRATIGRVEQEAPGGTASLIDFVLSADHERLHLLHEAEEAHDPQRISDIQARLVDIDAHSAPARAATILHGLGFDSQAQNRALSEFSGGWRMRVALAAVLFSTPDLLLLDEPTNYLDLEGTLWLVDYLRHYPATILVISHDRDVLDEVADHILHLDGGKLTLWKGNYSAFEKQRRELQTILIKQAKKQDERRKHMQSFVDRFRASATKARQAQSRLKALAKLENVAAIIDSDVLPFDFPSPQKPLSPPIVTLENVATGYGNAVILSHLCLSLAEDDRIGLLGANGNGKSTFAKLLGGRLNALSGEIVRASKLETGFFAQHQVEDLELDATPFQLLSRLMAGQPESKIRARCARLGFSHVKADTKIGLLSGGEKARLLMGISTFNAPHLLILDEPTNHLDIDSRVALIEAINAYEGAIIIISHDRYLLDACANRLWLVANGTVNAFNGDMDDYRDYVLGLPAAPTKRKLKEKDQSIPQLSATTKDANASRKALAPVRKKLEELEAKIDKFTTLLQRVDVALAHPDTYTKDPEQGAKLASQRSSLAQTLSKNEEEWLKLSSEYEKLMVAR